MTCGLEDDDSRAGRVVCRAVIIREAVEEKRRHRSLLYKCMKKISLYPFAIRALQMRSM